MDRRQRIIADHVIERLSKHLNTPKKEISDDVYELVAQAVSVEEHYPLEQVVTSPDSAHSTKLTNLSVDIPKLALLIGQLPALASEDLTIQYGAIATLCGTICRWTKVDLSVEQGFVYWIAYTRRHRRWEIPESELLGHVLDEAATRSEELSIEDEQDVNQVLIHLERNGCISREVQQGERYVVVEETCKSKWQ